MTMGDGTPSFPARASHPSLGDDSADGMVTVDRWHLRFQSPQCSLDIPLTRLQIDAGDSGEILFSDPEEPDWLLSTADTRILRHQALQRQSVTRLQIRALKS